MSEDAPKAAVSAMEPGANRIPVRSHRQAMDWGLVLMSQGIESTIDQAEDKQGWGLLVDRQNYTPALRVLRQYQLENRGWAWQQVLPWPAVHFDWGCLVWAALLSFFYWMSSGNANFLAAGILDTRAVSRGEWWRIFTAMQLHADLGHLATNLSIGIVLLGLAMGRYGTAVGIAAAYLAGAGGNVVSLLFNAKPFHGLGASGMVMGALGLLAAQTLILGKSAKRPLKYVVGGLAGGMMLFVLFGLSMQSDIAAHFGGFVTGVILGAGLTFVPPKRLQSGKLNVMAGVALGIMVVLTWHLALR